MDFAFLASTMGSSVPRERVNRYFRDHAEHSSSHPSPSSSPWSLSVTPEIAWPFPMVRPLGQAETSHR